MFKPIAVALAVLSSVTNLNAQKTFCNPLNLPYNFQGSDAFQGSEKAPEKDPNNPTRREAADPVIVLYQNKYWLFASKQIGYWWSDDMTRWHLVQPTGLPLQVYAPAIAVVDGKLYYTAGEDKGTFTTDDPLKGQWTPVNPYKRGCADPDLFQDTDGRVYLFDGCSDKTPLRVTELDRHTFLPLGDPVNAIGALTHDHGWEVPGDNNEDTTKAPWIEGSWVTKLDGHYFWQYAGPGTQFKTYGDGVYVSDKPMGPYRYQAYSPFSFKPTGFIAGSGHSCTFADKQNRLWHISTGTISVRHMFERRLMLFPAGYFPANQQLAVNTYLGDYPQLAPGTAKDQLQDNLAGWMLLSYHKPATASSTLKPTSFAFDEDIRTWWSAQTGNPGEWLQVDLGKTCRINAIQVNFADQDAEQHGPLINDGYRYTIGISQDGKTWKTLIDKNDKDRDTPHDYTELEKPAMARYVKIINGHSPAHSRFSLYDLRVFGSALGQKPEAVGNITIERDKQDRRHATVTWSAVKNTDLYIVRYGLSPDKLFGNYQVYNATSLDIRSLNTDTSYYFTVDAVNGSGITKGPEAK